MSLFADPLNQIIITKLTSILAEAVKTDTLLLDTRLNDENASVGGSTSMTKVIDVALTASRTYLLTGLTIYYNGTNITTVVVGDENIATPISGDAIFEASPGTTSFQIPQGLVIPFSGRLVISTITALSSGTVFAYATYKESR